MITHPLVSKATCTCWACPDQWEGMITDGRYFYLRYRSGVARLGIGGNVDEAIEDTMPGGRGVWVQVGDPLDGVFESDEARNKVFAELLNERLADPPPQ